MRAGVFYHEDFSEHGYPVLQERMAPAFRGLADLIESGRLVRYTPQVTRTAERLLSSTHTPHHIARVKSEGYHYVSLLSAAGVVEAAERLAAGELDFAFAFVGAAGHHASRDRYWGFCFYNDAAMAVQRLRELGVRRIMIIDVDPHFGDGTRDLLGPDSEVIHVNFHSGRGDKEDPQLNNYDYGIGGADDALFMDTLNRVLARKWDFEFLMVIFGHDSHFRDYGGFQLSDLAFPFLARRIREFAAGRPVLFILSGGADPEVGRTAVRSVVEEFLR